MKWTFAICLLFAFSACNKVGTTLPELNYVSVDGRTISQEQLKDKVLVINIWATWCGSCLKEIPALNRLKDKYANQNVLFLAFSDEPASQIKRVIDNYPFNYVQIANASSFIMKVKTRMVKTYPQNIVVNTKGEIVYERTEGDSDIYSELDNEIDQLLNQ